MDKKQGPEAPQKHSKKVTLDDVFPDVIMKIMLGDNHADIQSAKGQDGERDAFPVPGRWSENSDRNRNDKRKD
jgi:hypothetical protein